MKKLIMLIMVLSFTLIFAVSSTTKIEFKANTGDKELDVSLSEFNVEANLNIKTFNANMIGTYDITEKKIEMLRVKSHMQPSDIYMALEVSKVSEKPMKDVISSWQKNNGKGWGFIAKGLGIKPGSKEFKALKTRVRERKHIKEKKKVENRKAKKKIDSEPKKSEMKNKKEAKDKSKK